MEHPVFRGTRVPFKNLIDYLEGGHSLGEFLRQFPTVSHDMAIQVLQKIYPQMAQISADENKIYTWFYLLLSASSADKFLENDFATYTFVPLGAGLSK